MLFRFEVIFLSLIYLINFNIFQMIILNYLRYYAIKWFNQFLTKIQDKVSLELNYPQSDTILDLNFENITFL